VKNALAVIKWGRMAVARHNLLELCLLLQLVLLVKEKLMWQLCPALSFSPLLPFTTAVASWLVALN